MVINRLTALSAAAPSLPPSCLFRLPISSSLLRRGDGSAAVTHVECICHGTKRQSVQPSAPIWRHFSSRCHPVRGGVVIREAVSLLRTHDITSTFLLFLFILLLLCFLFSQPSREEKQRELTREWEQKTMLPSKSVNLYS